MQKIVRSLQIMTITKNYFVHRLNSFFQEDHTMLSDYQQPPRPLFTIILDSSTAAVALIDKDNDIDNNITLELSEESSSTIDVPTLSSILQDVLEILEDIEE